MQAAPEIVFILGHVGHVVRREDIPVHGRGPGIALVPPDVEPPAQVLGRVDPPGDHPAAGRLARPGRAGQPPAGAVDGREEGADQAGQDHLPLLGVHAQDPAGPWPGPHRRWRAPGIDQRAHVAAAPEPWLAVQLARVRDGEAVPVDDDDLAQVVAQVDDEPAVLQVIEAPGVLDDRLVLGGRGFQVRDRVRERRIRREDRGVLCLVILVGRLVLGSTGPRVAASSRMYSSHASAWARHHSRIR